ncbi:MAG: Lrp/AsnC family transcriptional regulator [Crenarchaeota archaeon]|nr:Lrp/AsnC family transcriptional regulator [Thermoproteota archaeon]
MSSTEPALDELDLKILRHLMADSRMSYRKIAKELGVAPGTVLARIRRMEENKVLKKYTLSVDYEKLGFTVTSVTEIRVSKGKLVEVEKKLAELPGVCAVYDVTGDVDAIVISKFRNPDELSRFTKRVLSMPNVERTNTHFVLTVVKEDFNIPI